MNRPRKNKSINVSYSKFARIFGLVMTLVYVSLGLFIMFVPEESNSLAIPRDMRYVIGGILILYGVLRFIRIYQTNAKNKRHNRYEE
ncbi:hypothetical protein [Pontibacter arcticus]|uniref:Uncharacterized protein n=1 Tax=Pontibacter arcticus TaxID=2080288 RepID=A0A364RB54_9BACT|nr:hypothetical protein [Pontibacter arcticus]RAU81519.1 hypothetical protein DP923_15545 [Pontibacter arcticus]